MPSKNDYKILSIFSKNGCTTELKSHTIKYLQEATELSYDKVRNTIQYFIKLGFLKEGARQHRTKTYYITREGIEKMKELT